MVCGCESVRKSKKEKLKERFQPKSEFVERMEALIGKADAEKFFEISYSATPDSIRVNTLKISVEELKKRLEGYGWALKQPFLSIGFDEILVVDESCGKKLNPGELGKTKEHLLGYYYVQDISSMLPLLVLKPSNGEFFLDLCASPGSKTTQAAAMMENGGTIIANEVSLGRISALNANMERCGVANSIVTRKEGVALCEKFLKKTKFRFDKILVDAPCSGEGTLRKSPKTFLMWNKNMIKKIASTQRKLAAAAMKVLKVNGEMIYSTCTLAPEENEEVVDFLIRNFDVEVEEIDLPLKLREGIVEWDGKKYSDKVKKAKRLYPQDNNTDGFFVCKLKKKSEECLLREK